MANIITQTFRRYPITLWAGVGVAAYVWKASFVAFTYNNYYKKNEEERTKELTNV